MNERFVLWASTNALTTWVVRHFATHLDPRIFRATNGAWTSMGRPTMPMVTLTTKGAKTGRERLVHLACIEHEGAGHVVASAMGQKRHPGWRYNLEAHPETEVQAEGERYRARAERLTAEEKQTIWPRVHELLPQMKVYEGRTDREICVYRLARLD